MNKQHHRLLFYHSNCDNQKVILFFFWLDCLNITKFPLHFCSKVARLLFFWARLFVQRWRSSIGTAISPCLMSCLKKNWSCLRKSIWLWSGNPETSFFLNISDQGTRRELILKRTTGTTAAQLALFKTRGRWSMSLYQGDAVNLHSKIESFDRTLKMVMTMNLNVQCTFSSVCWQPLWTAWPLHCQVLATINVKHFRFFWCYSIRPPPHSFFFDSNSIRQLYPRYGSAMVWEYDQLLAKKPNRLD